MSDIRESDQVTGWYRRHRRWVWPVAVLLIVVAAAAVWLWTLPSNNDELSMGDYGPDKQRQWADRLVLGLNTRDAERVPVYGSTIA